MEPKKKRLGLKPKKLRFFKSGSLIFINSRHSLTLSDRYYRCSLNCKGKCKNKTELQLNKRTFERKFCRLASKLKIDHEKAVPVFKTVVREMFCQLIMDDETNDQSDKLDDVIMSTLDTMEQGAMGIKTEPQREKFNKTGKFPGGTISKSDIRDYQDAYVKSLNEKRTYWVMAHILAFIKSLSDPINIRDKGNALACISKKIYISDRGDIIKIELEPWGQYICNFIDHRVPGLLSQLSKARIEHFNNNDASFGLNPIQAGKHFKCSSNDLFFNNDGNQITKFFEMAKRMINIITGGGDTRVMQRELFAFFYALRTDPAFSLSMEQLPILLKVAKIK